MRRFLLILIAVSLLSQNVSAVEGDIDDDGILDENDTCPNSAGNSTIDEIGCPDLDGDGYANMVDACPMFWGKSKFIIKGCNDMDGDFMPDIYDDDADGDGIRNEMERAASTGLRMYDPYDADSTPSDVDEDTIPDVLDPDADNDGIINEFEIEASRVTGLDYSWLDGDKTPPDYDNDGSPDAIDSDSDNDGWPDLVELDRGSNHLGAEQTPLNMYFGINSGTFYHGGLSFEHQYDPKAIEFSVSFLVDVITGELILPLLLVPIYLLAFLARRRKFNLLMIEIEDAEDPGVLSDIELRTNELVKNRRLKVYHGLVLRNTIEAKETEMGGEPLLLENIWARGEEE